MRLRYRDGNKGLQGHWRIDAYEGEIERDSTGRILNRLVQTVEGENLILKVGKEMVMDRLFGLSAVGAMTRIGVGTSGTAAAEANTALTEPTWVAYSKTPVRTALKVVCEAEFGTAVGNKEWKELGMDNGTTLLNRIAPIGPITKTEALSLIVTVTITQA